MGGRVTGHQSLLQNLIGDELLTEILCRIPTPVQAIQCKLVCKGWCSLISSSYFIRRFKQHHMKHESIYPKPILGMLANTVVRINMSDFENDPDDVEFNFRGFNLDYIPVKKGNVMVVASCNDLIICKAEYPNFYLCNPFTMQCVALPPPPPHQSRCLHIIGTALVCQPYNNSAFRYRIVHFYHEYANSYLPTRYMVEIYCSETSQWTQCDDLGEDFWYNSKIAAYNGKLHWVKRGGEYLVTYDPFNMQTSLRLMNGPRLIRHIDPNTGFFLNSEYYHVGECEGVLRVMRLECRLRHHGDPNETMIIKNISVWELQDTAGLIFKDLIVFNKVVSGNPDLRNIQEVGFHPRNKDVLFIVFCDILTSFNMKTREFKVETEYCHIGEPKWETVHCYHNRYAFALQLPWWPTPIPSPSPTS